MVNNMYDKFFTIKDYPNDVYNAVGQIIKNSQYWERDYKKLAKMLNVNINKINIASLNRLNNALKKQHSISDKEYNNLKKVIHIRNYINHEFYLNDFDKTYESFKIELESLENKLNMAQFLIFEAHDVTKNIIDKLNGSNIVRPTVFDNK